MKKVLVMLSMVLFCTCAFALNAPAKDACATQKADFEKNVASQTDESFIAQNILINMADPMQNMPDEQALPVAACYATFMVKGVPLTQFVRAHADIFPGDISGKEAAEMRAFAARVEKLGTQAQLNQMAAQGNTSHLVQFILINLADPMATMSDEEAAPLARAYQDCTVNGRPMLEFVRVHASEFAGNVPQELDAFVERVNQLAQ